MGFKIPGPKGAALGKFKPACEAWVDAFLVGDQHTADVIRKKFDEFPDSPEKRIALLYLDKKAKAGVQTTHVPPPVKKTPIDTMRQAVNLLAMSRRPFAEAMIEGIKDHKVTEQMLNEIKAVCDSAMDTLRRHSEYVELYKVPDTIK